MSSTRPTNTLWNACTGISIIFIAWSLVSNSTSLTNILSSVVLIAISYHILVQ